MGRSKVEVHLSIRVVQRQRFRVVFNSLFVLRKHVIRVSNVIIRDRIRGFDVHSPLESSNCVSVLILKTHSVPKFDQSLWILRV